MSCGYKRYRREDLIDEKTEHEDVKDKNEGDNKMDIEKLNKILDKYLHFRY